MCGLAAVLVEHAGRDVPPHVEAIPEAWLDALDDAIAHRGPDGHGRFRDRLVRDDGVVIDVAFVHRRLSIIDHAGGHQPMVLCEQHLAPELTYGSGQRAIIASEATDAPDLVAVVFNGCLYNHRAVRRSLHSLGEAFESDHSDTEAMLRGWHRLGDEMRHRLDGMYAAVWWDRRLGRLVARRDIAGEKPLYRRIATAEGVRIEAYSSVPLGNAGLAWAPIGQPGRRWATHGWAKDPSRDETQATAGDWGSGQRLGRPAGGRGDPEAPPLTADEVDAMLTRSVAQRIEADVPLGCFLSGGVDSSLIAHYAQQVLTRRGRRLSTFCLRMPAGAYDESQHAAAAAAAIGTDHTTIDVQPDPAGDLVHLIETLGLPLADSSLLPTYWISRAAREHVTVALAGDGGDELFGGYSRYAGNRVLGRCGWLLGLLPEAALPDREPTSRWSRLRRLAMAAKGDRYEDLVALFPRVMAQRVFAGGSERRAEHIRDPLSWDFAHYLSDDLLRKVDTASMAVALEVRCPMLSSELIVRCLGAPLDVLMPGGERKGLLRRVARRHLPALIVDRPKQGFAIPIGRWLREDFGGLRELLNDMLRSTEPFAGLGIDIDRSQVDRMLDEHDRAGERSALPWKGRDHGQRLYGLLVLSVWCRWRQSMRATAPSM